MLLIPKNEEELEKIINENSNIYFYFTARWCNPCKMISPYFEELVEGENITGVKLDIDLFPDLSDYMEVYSVPTFIRISDETKYTGVNKDKLKELIV